MYKKQDSNLEFVDFYLPFGGKLRRDNRWVKLAELIPWEELEEEYSKNFSKYGNSALSVRIALGSLIIKERLNFSDIETVEQIQENPYLQYFLGYTEYIDEQPFDSSVMVNFRKRFSEDILQRVNEKIISYSSKSLSDSDDDNDKGSPENRGKLIVDATCAPHDVKFPTDINLVNNSREKLEEIIDVLHAPFIGYKEKPRTKRKTAAKEYNNIKKCKRWSNNKRRKFLGKQLRYIKMDIGFIDNMLEFSDLSLLSSKQYKDLLVVQEIYRQQTEMYETHSHSVANRIISIDKPFLRPIKRGKLGADVEFGAKISLSLINGLAYIDRMDFEAFNEAEDLINQIEQFKVRTGCYPESVHADKIYRNRVNLGYCKDKGIRLSGPKLGRPPKDEQLNELIKQQAYKDECYRVRIEGKFGQLKRRFGMNRIMARLANTAGSEIAMNVVVGNLEKLLADAFLCHIYMWVLKCYRKSQFFSTLQIIKYRILNMRILFSGVKTY